MCTSCLNYQFLARSNLSTSANLAPAPDVQAPAFVVETVENPSAEPASQNGLVAGANYVEIADAPDDVSTPYELVAGDSFAGTISDQWNGDWIRITVDPDTTIEAKLSTGTSPIATKLYDQDGNYLRGADRVGEIENKIIYRNESNESVEIYVSANFYSNFSSVYPVNYTATVQEVPHYVFEEGADAPANVSTSYELITGGTFTGTTLETYDDDWIRTTVDPNTTIEITSSKNTPSNGSVIGMLYDENGNYIKSRDEYDQNSSTLIYENETDEVAVYYFRTRAVEVNSSRPVEYPLEYTVTVQDRTPPPPTPPNGVDYIEEADAPDGASTPYQLVAGESFYGEISGRSDKDWVEIDLTAGQTYWFSVDGSDELIDTWLRLRAADGSLIAWDDDAGPGRFSYLNFAPTTSGTYYLSVESEDATYSGTYTLSTGTRDPLPAPLFTDTETEDAPDNSTTNYNLQVGDSFSGVLEDGNAHEVDWVRISLEAGETYVFELDTARTYLTLSNDGGYYLHEGSRNSTADTNILVYTASRTGDFYLGASSPAHSSFAGDYQITTRQLTFDETTDAAANTATTAEVSVGETFTGLTRLGYDTDWIRIQLARIIHVGLADVVQAVELT